MEFIRNIYRKYISIEQNVEYMEKPEIIKYRDKENDIFEISRHMIEFIPKVLVGIIIEYYDAEIKMRLTKQIEIDIETKSYNKPICIFDNKIYILIDGDINVFGMDGKKICQIKYVFAICDICIDNGEIFGIRCGFDRCWIVKLNLGDFQIMELFDLHGYYTDLSLPHKLCVTQDNIFVAGYTQIVVVDRKTVKYVKRIEFKVGKSIQCVHSDNKRVFISRWKTYDKILITVLDGYNWDRVNDYVIDSDSGNLLNMILINDQLCIHTNQVEMTSYPFKIVKNSIMIVNTNNMEVIKHENIFNGLEMAMCSDNRFCIVIFKDKPILYIYD